MLDLGLRHLGIEIDKAINEEELDLVINTCGHGESEYFFLLVSSLIAYVTSFNLHHSVSRFRRLSKPRGTRRQSVIIQSDDFHCL